MSGGARPAPATWPGYAKVAIMGRAHFTKYFAELGRDPLQGATCPVLALRGSRFRHGFHAGFCAAFPSRPAPISAKQDRRARCTSWDGSRSLSYLVRRSAARLRLFGTPAAEREARSAGGSQ